MDNKRNITLKVKVFESREEMGQKAAREAGKALRDQLNQKEVVNVIFAAAPSQNEFLKYLIKEEEIAWTRVNAFHMDEYIGLEKDAPQGFGNILQMQIFDKVPFASVNYINGQAEDLDQECKRYEQLLNDYPVDIVCMGIGENGHIAFNDPPVANFHSIDQVPQRAFTLTIPSLMKASRIFCVVPGERKAEAVANTLIEKRTNQHPSTILRTHNNVVIYLDKQSSMMLV